IELLELAGEDLLAQREVFFHLGRAVARLRGRFLALHAEEAQGRQAQGNQHGAALHGCGPPKTPDAATRPRSFSRNIRYAATTKVTRYFRPPALSRAGRVVDERGGVSKHKQS